MKRFLSVIAVGFMFCTLIACLNKEGTASTPANERPLQNEEHGLSLSDIQLNGIEEIAGMSGKALIEKNGTKSSETQTAMQISVKANDNTTVFELNNSPAARDLYAQLPLRITVEKYSNNEKIFYPPKKLNTTDTPQADGGHAGTLAYYAPWGDVVMFYGSFGSAAGLYELGHVISGSEYIQGMSGTIQIVKSSAP